MRKKFKKNNKNKKIILLILILIGLLIINPRKKYYQFVLKRKNYSKETIEVILDNKLQKDFISKDYNKKMDILLKNNKFNENNYKSYKKLKYYDLKNYSLYVNKLLKKGYNEKVINSVLKSKNDKDIEKFISLKYQSEINNYVNCDGFTIKNYDRYIKYKDKYKNDYSKTVTYVNIGLDKIGYKDYDYVKDFSYDMLVNKYNKLEDDFIPDDLIKISSNYAVDENQYGNKKMIENFKKMADDCKKNTGYKILVKSGFRSYSKQEEIYDYYKKINGSNYAESYVAKPGFSEHQTGLAVDIKAESNSVFENTKESNWLINNAYKYGFILRYSKNSLNITGYSYESWHFRYVGKDIAKYIFENKITYEEYYAKFLYF